MNIAARKGTVHSNHSQHQLANKINISTVSETNS